MPTKIIASTSHVLFAAALGLAIAGCQVSTSGLLNKAKGGGSSSGGGSSGDSSSGGGSSSDSSSGGGSSGDSSGGSDSAEAEMPAVEIPYFPPGPGLAAVGAYKMPWCKGKNPDADAGSLSRTVRGQYALDSAASGVPNLCAYPDDSRFQKLVGAYWQLFVNDTGATPAEVAAYLTLFQHEDDYKQLNEATCKKFKIDDEASEREKALSRMSSAVVGCDSYGQVGHPMWMDSGQSIDMNLHGLWHIDREAELPSQLVGVYHVLQCVGTGETTDTCADVTALREELKRVGRKERSLFYMGHFGGILVNLGGAAYVWRYDTASKALLSVAVGYPVGLLSNYTMPRGAWHKWREASWTTPVVTVMPRDDGWLLTAAGSF